MTNLNCDFVFGLYFSDPEMNSEKIVHAVSTDKTKLLNLLKTISNDYKQRSRIEILPIKMYSVTKLHGIVNYSKLMGKNKDLLFLKVNQIDSDILNGKLYGFNYNNNNNYEQAILYVSSNYKVDTNNYNELIELIRNEDFFKYNISENYIHFDKYYDEGIINA